MKPLELEAWALRILERVENKQPVEDSRVELKAQWPDPLKTARQIAGHANAAKGEPVLWLIGVDENNGVKGADFKELSNWFAQISACFDGTTPELQDLNVQFKGNTVAALCFDSSRFPFVVKNPAFGTKDGGPVKFEVPFREGVSTRTATRSDLVSILTPLIRLPKVELLLGHLTLEQPSGGSFHFLKLLLFLYVVPTGMVSLTFPFHKCGAVLSFKGSLVTDEFSITLTTPREAREHRAKMQSLTQGGPAFPQLTFRGNEIIETTEDEIIVRGAGKLILEGKCPVTTIGDWAQAPELSLRVTITEAQSDLKLPIDVTLFRRTKKPDGFVWDSPR